MKVTWHDAGRESQCAPNPQFPEGVDLDCSAGSPATCSTDLPYPAKRCGQYVVVCETCGQRAVVTTAGRADDPRSLKMSCQLSDKSKAQ